MDNLDLDLRELTQLLAIAAEGSFARASRRLYVSQPALSRSIQEAERKTGLRLFERGRRGAVPTDAGRMVLQHAETVMAAARDMQRDLTLIRGLATGELRIGTGVYPPDLFLGSALGRLVRQGTDIRLRMVGAPAPELMHLLRKREIDLVVADPVWLEKTTDVSVVDLSSHQAHLFVRTGHPLLDLSAPTPEQIVAYPLVTSSAVPPRLAVLYEPGNSAFSSMPAPFGRWTPTVYTDSIVMMKETVLNSDAVTLLSLHLARHELERNELKILPISLPWLKPRFAFMYLSHRTLSPLAEALIRETTAVAAALQQEEREMHKQWIGKRKGGKKGPKKKGAKPR